MRGGEWGNSSPSSLKYSVEPSEEREDSVEGESESVRSEVKSANSSKVKPARCSSRLEVIVVGVRRDQGT